MRARDNASGLRQRECTVTGTKVIFDRRWYSREDLRNEITPGKDLHLVYISACHGGDAAPAWREAFAPARVVIFDRNSANLEHAFWFWFSAPAIVAGLE